ncbi:MAG: DUF4290 domain-containing protein [Bacteroidales bacterium]|nr:DUF4290 domain-containing protein [Bacteroidales bacterium]
MEYNTTREKMVIPEYGRNIQKMIEYACEIEDREKRTKMAYFIVKVMAQMHPEMREAGGDLNHKLWDHLILISGFKLDVDGPYDPPEPNVLVKRPEPLQYKMGNIAFRHYGKNLANMIQKAVEYSEGTEKKALVRTLANHMKKSYLTWNRQSVDHDVIEKHLSFLSGDKLELHEDAVLNTTSEILARNRRKRPTTRQNTSNNNQSMSRRSRRPRMGE